MSEYALGHIKPPIGTPGKSVEQFMAIIETESSLQDGLLIRNVVAVCVFEEKKIGRLAHINSAVAQQNARGQVEAIDEYRDLIGFSIAVGIFENLDPVARLLALGRSARILIQLEHPK